METDLESIITDAIEGHPVPFPDPERKQYEEEWDDTDEPITVHQVKFDLDGEIYGFELATAVDDPELVEYQVDEILSMMIEQMNQDDMLPEIGA